MDLVRIKEYCIGKFSCYCSIIKKLYGIETRTLNQAVKRNIKRFPCDFMIKLNHNEIMRISQIVTSLKF